MRAAILFLVCISLIGACSPAKEKFPPEPAMETSSGKLIVYQMMTRLFGNKLTNNIAHGTIEQNGVGKFNDITPAALRGVKELGVTHVWYTGVIEHGVINDYTSYGIPLDDADVVKGRAGSPYAIKDYYDVNPDLAVDVRNRMREFESLVKRTHDAGMKVIVDFVPNHVARNYKSDAKPAGVVDLGERDDKSLAFKTSNNFYYLPGTSFQVPQGYIPLGDHTFPTKDGKFDESPAKVTGNDQFTHQPGINEWFETIKLNYGVDIQNGRKTYFDPVPDTWIKMKDILLFWTDKNVDGFRCDMAEMVPVEFWNWAIPLVKEKHPEVLFIAEIYNPGQYENYIHTGKFDFLYDKVQLYDTLRFLLGGQRSTADIPAIQRSLKGINHHMLHFLENHDEQRIASKYFAGDPWKAVPAMVVSATIDKGPVMIYFGQEVGEPGSGAEGFGSDDGRTTIYDYWGVPEHQKWMNNGSFDGALLTDAQKLLRKFYIDLLALAGSNAAINSGEYLDLTEANITAGNFGGKISAFMRYTENEKLLIVTSFASTDINARIAITEEAATLARLSKDDTYQLTDLLHPEVSIELKELVLTATLKPYSAHIFQIK